MANKKPIRNNRAPLKNKVNQANKINKRFVRKRVPDARQKIIQKKRKHVVDARDVLAKIAKKHDARSKLLKIRETRTNTNGNNVQVIGKNILRKTGPDGKISLLTSKSKQSTANTMNLAIKHQLGLISNNRSPKKPVKRPVLPPRAVSPTLIRKTIYNDMDLEYERFARGYSDSETLYKWVRPDLRAGDVLRRPLLTSRGRDLLENGGEWRRFPPTSRSVRPATTYIDLDAVDDEEMPLMAPVRQTISLQGSSRSSNVHSRLDTYPIDQTHGILGQSTTKTKVVVPAGHRIVVSNLQPTVTQDDIKELFEDIGQLLVARLVRPGTAEVIYKNLRDAQKAVDTYHNRQLDGQPMKCLLVNKRPANNPTGPALPPQTASEGVLSSRSKVSTDKLVPDISTIHKVLFQRK